MFEEEKKSWKEKYICAMLICFINLGIIITCRALLDSENEFDEPIITGDTRLNLQFFLLYFSVTFCFGCCCCFFCMGKCCGWISFICHCCNWSLSEAMTESLRKPAAEALRQQHEQIDAARARRKSLFPPERPTNLPLPLSTPRQYNNLGFGTNEQIV